MLELKFCDTDIKVLISFLTWDGEACTIRVKLSLKEFGMLRSDVIDSKSSFLFSLDWLMVKKC